MSALLWLAVFFVLYLSLPPLSLTVRPGLGEEGIVCVSEEHGDHGAKSQRENKGSKVNAGADSCMEGIKKWNVL